MRSDSDAGKRPDDDHQGDDQGETAECQPWLTENDRLAKILETNKGVAHGDPFDMAPRTPLAEGVNERNKPGMGVQDARLRGLR
jgi:hypothetical protein